MAGPIYVDRAQEVTTTTGTGTYTLGGAVAGYQSFAAVGNGNTCYYSITDGTNWEVGLGTYTSAGTTLARTAVLASSNANAAVNWAAGTRNIWVDSPALFFTGLVTAAGSFSPTADDGKALGTIALGWSDGFFASGGVLNWANGNATITHSTGLLTFNVPVSLGTSNAFTAGTIELGAASDTTISRDSAGVIAVEGVPLFSNIPQNSKSAAYTLVLSDAQKHIFHPSADTTARIWTIPANSSVAFPIGTAVTFVNQNAAGVITIAITTDTMRLAGPGTTGSRTLAANGIATALKVTSTEWLISGTGLT